MFSQYHLKPGHYVSFELLINVFNKWSYRTMFCMQHAELLEKLQAVQASQKELDMMVSTAEVHSQRFKRYSVLCWKAVTNHLRFLAEGN